MEKINIAILGVGNCASSLAQGIQFYRTAEEDAIGLANYRIGNYRPEDINIAMAIDIDARKVGQSVSVALFKDPNCTQKFQPILPDTKVIVKMGRVLDSVSPHLEDFPEDHRIVVSNEPEVTQEEIVRSLVESEIHVLVNYLPVGSEKATHFYAECALEAGVAFVNCIPVFIASEVSWSKRFFDSGVPLIGDDIKSQLGATIIHRTITNLFEQRGVRLDRTYQLNTGGNSDFLNMLNRDRLQSKKISKTEAVQSMTGKRLKPENIHIGPSDYVPWQKDNKISYIRMEGRGFGEIPVKIDLKLSVEDSPNCAGVAIDCIRCCKLALDRGIGGVLAGPASYFMKHPPQQFPDSQAFQLTKKFIDETYS